MIKITCHRLQIAFFGSQFEYKRRVILALYGFITTMLCISIVGSFTETYGEWMYNEEEAINWCQGIVPVWGAISTVLTDSLLSIALMIMFLRPLILLIKYESANNRKLKRLVIKYALLSVIALISTFINMVMVCTNAGSFGAIDTIVNSICIMLMNQIHAHIYNVVCEPCTRCIERCSIGSYLDGISNVKRLEKGVNDDFDDGKRRMDTLNPCRTMKKEQVQESAV